MHLRFAINELEYLLQLSRFFFDLRYDRRGTPDGVDEDDDAFDGFEAEGDGGLHVVSSVGREIEVIEEMSRLIED